MDRSMYPANWEEISQRVRFERAGGRCECRGECGRSHEKRVTIEVVDSPEDPELWVDDRCGAVHGEPHPVTRSKVVLTVAHLDRDPAGEDEARMRAMCQRCHLAYDLVGRRNARSG